MLSEKEFMVLYEFLDRVKLKGHNERSSMNAMIIKLREISDIKGEIPLMNDPKKAGDKEAS